MVNNFKELIVYQKAHRLAMEDALGEEFETEDWLDYSRDCEYISDIEHQQMISGYDEVRKMLISMINNPEKWCVKQV
jgi:four helix bundle protein